jgi:hypothetical protein
MNLTRTHVGDALAVDDQVARKQILSGDHRQDSRVFD